MTLSNLSEVGNNVANYGLTGGQEEIGFIIP